MQGSEALQAYFDRVKPAIPELFNMAHAICGSREQAVYALQCALVDAWLGESHGGVGFREGLRYALRGVALEEALGADEAQEFTWNGLLAGGDPISALIAQEPLGTRRALALRYGCGLSAAKIARLTGGTAGGVREAVGKFERRALRQIPDAGGRGGREARIARAVRRAMARPDASMPSMSAIYRAFAAEAAQTRRPRHLAARAVRRVLYALLVGLCALAFWLMAALIQPAEAAGPARSALVWVEETRES